MKILEFIDVFQRINKSKIQNPFALFFRVKFDAFFVNLSDHSDIFQKS